MRDENLIVILELLGNVQGSCVSSSVVDKFAVNEDIPPLGEIWVSDYFDHVYEYIRLRVSVKLYFPQLLRRG